MLASTWLHALADLGHREVLVAIIHRFELAAVNRNNGAGEQAQLAAQHHKLGTHRPDRLAIVPAEVGNRLEIRHQPPGQPHQLDIALRFALHPPARLNPVQITVEINLQQRHWMVRGTAGRCRYNARKAQHRQIQFINEGIDDADRVIFPDVVVQQSGSKISWLRSWPSTKRFIPVPPNPREEYQIRRFHTASTIEGV